MNCIGLKQLINLNSNKMKLTIVNYDKTAGRNVGGDWQVYGVEEREESYLWTIVNQKTSEMRSVYLERYPSKENGAFFFLHPAQYATIQTCVTADWFADMDNALTKLYEELDFAEVVFNPHKYNAI